MNSLKKKVDSNIWLLKPEETSNYIIITDLVTYPNFIGFDELTFNKLEFIQDNSSKFLLKERKMKGKRNKKKINTKTSIPISNNPLNNAKKAVKDIEDKNVYGEFKNVWLKPNELNSLKRKYPQDYMEIIEKLSSYKESKEKDILRIMLLLINGFLTLISKNNIKAQLKLLIDQSYL